MNRAGMMASSIALLLLGNRPVVSQTTPAERVTAARALIHAHDLDSAATLLHQVADSPSTAPPTDRATAFVWLGIVCFYQGDDSGTARSFRAALALDPAIDAGNLAATDSTLAATWRHEQAAVRRDHPTLTPASGSTPAPVGVVHDCVRGCKGGERSPRLLGLPQMRIDNPGQLGPSGVHGRVVVRAVVDETGRLEPETITMVSSSSAGFERSVRDVLPMLRFRPAAIGGQDVVARVELRFDIRAEGLDWVRYEVDSP